MIAGQQGEVGEWLAASPAQPLALDFSEGTRVEFGANSRGRVEAVTPEGALVTIERGSLSAKVTHRKHTSWRFGAGPFEVIVVGTSLDVSWDADTGAFELGVSRGSVRVHGPLIQGEQEVRAGERCVVDMKRKSFTLVEAAQANAVAAPPALSPAPSAQAPSETSAGADPFDLPPAETSGKSSSQPPPASWAALERAGKHDAAITAAERSGLARIYQSASADDLLSLARAGRLAGRADIERNALLACRSRFKGQPAAARAAYLLGRSTGAGEAASWFETYIREQPAGALVREASGRLIESQQRAGNVAATREAASRYLASYPDGPHASLARQVLAR
jgi:hypothetical protein